MRPWWGGAMSVVLNARRLRHELARRGLSATDLARESKLSPATISAALSGRAISAQSLSLIGGVLERVAALEVLDSLIVSESDEHTIG
jgi:transcriptional regulator with XRE-family HTH domain